MAENGMGALFNRLGTGAAEVSKFTQFCSSDRVGYAWSDEGPSHDVVEETTDDLRMLCVPRV